MGAFFLLGGTVLFFAGLGCLVIVFSSIVRRLNASRSSSAYFKSKAPYRDGILSGLGIVLIVAAQGFYWFHSEVERFIPFEESVPQVQIGFVYEEWRAPRLELQSADQNNQLSTLVIPFQGDKVSIGVEVISWKRLFKVLGLKDCYHITGIYYCIIDSTEESSLNHVPDYSLNGGPSGFVPLVNALGSAFPADLKVLISEPLATDGSFRYLVQIAPDKLFCTRAVDNKPTASYSK